jgi:hypothetical protein
MCFVRAAPINVGHEMTVALLREPVRIPQEAALLAIEERYVQITHR